MQPTRYDAFKQRLVDAVLSSPGDTPAALRSAVFERGTRPGMASRELPGPLASYVDKVARHAYKVTDEDVAALQRGGNSDDALFEITVAAALGAALVRLDRGMAALRGEESD